MCFYRGNVRGNGRRGNRGRSGRSRGFGVAGTRAGRFAASRFRLLGFQFGDPFLKLFDAVKKPLLALRQAGGRLSGRLRFTSWLCRGISAFALVVGPSNPWKPQTEETEKRYRQNGFPSQERAHKFPLKEIRQRIFVGMAGFGCQRKYRLDALVAEEEYYLGHKNSVRSQ